MEKKLINLLTGHIAEEQEMLSLVELCHCCGLPAEQVITMIEHGLVEPLEPDLSISCWQFTGDSVLRIQTALRLQRDLHVNLNGAILAIDLIDEIKTLRQTIAFLERD